MSKQDLVTKMRREVDDKYKELIRQKNDEIKRLIVSYEMRLCNLCKHFEAGCQAKLNVAHTGCGLFEGTSEYDKKVKECLLE